MQGRSGCGGGDYTDSTVNIDNGHQANSATRRYSARTLTENPDTAGQTARVRALPTWPQLRGAQRATSLAARTVGTGTGSERFTVNGVQGDRDYDHDHDRKTGTGIMGEGLEK